MRSYQHVQKPGLGRVDYLFKHNPAIETSSCHLLAGLGVVCEVWWGHAHGVGVSITVTGWQDTGLIDYPPGTGPGDAVVPIGLEVIPIAMDDAVKVYFRPRCLIDVFTRLDACWDYKQQKGKRNIIVFFFVFG